MPHKPSVYAELRFQFFARGSTVVRHLLEKNEIQLDFSQSSQRAELHFFLNKHLFLHAEAAEKISDA